MRDPGLLAGRYRLGSELGHGGMGRVWEAHDERLGRRVAVKEVLMPAELPTGEREVMQRRTLREARAAARISSPSAVTVYDVVDEDGRTWIVMERLEPVSLADVLARSGPVEPAEAARIGLRVLDALGAAHRAGVLHRDVKPANIMIGSDGAVVLTDFGVAVLDGDVTITTTGLVVGSPAYLAPERARGGHALPASDLFSLGATLYAAVEGTSPFQRNGQLATLAAVVSDAPAPPRDAGPLAPLLVRLLDKEPSRRPGHEEVRSALEAVAAGQPAVIAPAGLAPAPHHPGERTAALPPVVADPAAGAPAPAGPAARGRGRGALLVAALVLGLLGVAVGLWLTDRDEPTGTATPGGTPSGSVSPSGSPEASPAGTSPSASGPSSAPSSEAAGDGPPTAAPGDDDADGGADGGADGRGDAAEPVPAGFQRYTDPQGWSVAVPQGWDVRRRDGSRVDLGGGRGPFLRVDSTDTPAGDPVDDWRNQEGTVSQRLPGYDLVSITDADFRGWEAADWEFTFRPDGGQVRVVNRGFVVDDSEAHALYYSAPAGDFDAEVLRVAAATFTPSG
jgi:eukaryotic-like serine/threonine-protein kinase